MAKFNLFILFTLLSFNTVKAFDSNDTDSSSSSSLSSNEDEPKKGPRKSRRVSLTINMYQVDHTLYFNPEYVGCEFELSIDGKVVYVGIIEDKDGVVTLPNYLTGDFDVNLNFGGQNLTSTISL